MITDLETLLNDDQFKELVAAINANKDYKLAKDGLTIESKSTDNSLQISIAYDETKKEGYLANKERKDFMEFTNSLDDEIFISTCECLGNGALKQIADCINSSKLETVRAGSTKFKNAVITTINGKINYLKSCLTKLTK